MFSLKAVLYHPDYSRHVHNDSAERFQSSEEPIVFKVAQTRQRSSLSIRNREGQWYDLYWNCQTEKRKPPNCYEITKQLLIL